MRPERALIWLPLLGLAACSPGMVALSASAHCWGSAWICHEWGSALDVLRSELLVLLPWLALVILGLCAGLRQLARTQRALRQARSLPQVQLPVSLATLAYDFGIGHRLELVDCSSPEAFCYGFFRPRICVTTGLLKLLSLAELEAVLRHERHHLQRYDPLRALLWTMRDGACWWMERGGEQARLHRELAADRAVIAAGGRMSLASALLKLLAHPQRGALAACDLAISSLSVTDARIEQLLQPEQSLPQAKLLHHWLALPVVISLTVLLCAG